jgi:phage tail-like protein
MPPDDAADRNAFAFTVELHGRTVAAFAEMTGLTADGSLLRQWGEEIVRTVRKLVGQKKHANLTLKRGYTDSSDFWDWWRETRDGRDGGATRDLVVVLHDERRKPVRSWRIGGARVRDLVGPSFDPKANGTAIERLELTCESVRPSCR